MQDQIRAGILATANALGISPLDLATAISYETAGTFDPTKAGPTTKWGQHRGLIQFGEPQAQQYGVDWSNPIGSQLGPDGAVADYLRDTGVQPGMGLLDIYSAINAGAVGKYNASDAAAGGAPGTVRDKVENQMAGHREKAAAMLGGEFQMAGPSLAPKQPQSPFGGILGGSAPSTIPQDVAAFATSKDGPSFGDRLSKAGEFLDAFTPDPPRISPMGDARSSGNELLKYLKSMRRA